jgi:hypothetical protein
MEILFSHIITIVLYHKSIPMQKFILVLVALAVFFNGYGQIEKKTRFIIGSQFLGPTWFMALNAGYRFNENLNAEIGGGLVGYYGGLRICTSKKENKKTQLMSGIMLASALNGRAGGRDAGILAGKIDKRIYVPLGIKINKKKTFIMPEIAVNYFLPGFARENEIGFFLGFQTGVNF